MKEEICELEITQCGYFHAIYFPFSLLTNHLVCKTKLPLLFLQSRCMKRLGKQTEFGNIFNPMNVTRDDISLLVHTMNCILAGNLKQQVLNPFSRIILCGNFWQMSFSFWLPADCICQMRAAMATALQLTVSTYCRNHNNGLNYINANACQVLHKLATK